MKNFIIPSIDILDEKVVRLYKGDYNKKTVYNVDLQELLTQYKAFNLLHVVDLNAARNDGKTNIELIKNIRKNFVGKIQLGGGIRSIEIANKILNEIEIDRVVLGTIAVKEIDLTKKILEKCSSERVVLAIDCQLIEGKFIPKINGWMDQEGQGQDLFDILQIYQDLAKYILVTDISVDGTMSGANLELYRKIKEKFPQFFLQASGGVSSLQNIVDLQKVADAAIVGKALYDNQQEIIGAAS